MVEEAAHQRAGGQRGVEVGAHFAALLAALQRGGDLVAARDEHALAKLAQQLGVLALLDQQRAGELHGEAAPGGLQVGDQIVARVARVDGLDA